MSMLTKINRLIRHLTNKGHVCIDSIEEYCIHGHVPLPEHSPVNNIISNKAIQYCTLEGWGMWQMLFNCSIAVGYDDIGDRYILFVPDRYKKIANKLLNVKTTTLESTL